MGCSSSKQAVLPAATSRTDSATTQENQSTQATQASVRPVLSESASSAASPGKRVPESVYAAENEPSLAPAEQASLVVPSSTEAPSPARQTKTPTAASPAPPPVPAPAAAPTQAAPPSTAAKGGQTKKPSTTGPASPPPAAAKATPSSDRAASAATGETTARPTPVRRKSLKDGNRRGSGAWRTEGKITDLYTVAGGPPIGKGGFGEVRLGTRKSDGKT